MAAMCFRAFLVMDNKVARQEMAGNGLPRLFGRKWISAFFYVVAIEVARQASVSIGKHR